MTTFMDKIKAYGTAITALQLADSTSNHGQNTDTGTTGADFTVKSAGTTGKIKVAVATGASNKTLTVTNAALTGDHTATFQDATGTVALTSDLLLEETRDIVMSFEAAEVMTARLYFPYKVTVNKIRGIVTLAIAAADNGTITCGNATGASATGVITATASDALAVAYAVTPTTNNVVEADGYYYLAAAKTTPGGRVLVSLEVTRTA